MKKFLRLILFFLVLKSNAAFTQDINFSQFSEIPLLRNPSLAGIFEGDYRITSAFRNQWQSVTTPYKTFGLGLEYKRPVGLNSHDYFTIGLNATNDIAGDSRLSRMQVFPVFNYHKSLNSEKDTYLSAGIMGGAVIQRFDPSKLSFDDQFVNGTYSPSNPTKQVFNNTRLTFWDLTAGVNFSSVIGEDTRYYIGLGYFHITKPKVAFQKQYDILLNPKWVLNAGLTAPLNDVNKLVFYADYFMQGGARQIQGGLLLNHNFPEQANKTAITGGIFYRYKDAFVPVIQMEYSQMLIGLSYDINISKLKTASQLRGAYEITLSYKGFRHNYNSASDKTRCPTFY